MSHCLSYYVKLNSAGEPISGTMSGFNSQVTNPTCSSLGCNFAILQTSAYTNPDPDNCTQCVFPDNHRFFYGIDKSGHIVPNSLIQTLTYPVAPGRCSYYIEYKRYNCGC